MSNQKSSAVKKICLAYIDGHSMQHIAKALNAKHVPCFGGGIQWTQGQVAPQLRSELVRKVLTDEEFASLQAKLSQNKGRRGGKRGNDWISNLFPNRVRCAACGASVTTHNTKGGADTYKGTTVRRYYRCSAKCRAYFREMARIDAVEIDFFMLFFTDLIKSRTQLTAVADIEKVLAVNDWNKVEQLEQALRNPEVRAKLVQLLPNLVTCLTINFEKQSYSITTTDGATTPIRLLPDIRPDWWKKPRIKRGRDWGKMEFDQSKKQNVLFESRWFFLNDQWHLRAR